MSSPPKLHLDSASAVAVASAHEKSGSIVQAETLEASPVQSAAGLPLTSAKAEQIVQIAHDFNNLLTLVLGYGETILMSLPANHPVCQYANQICDAAREGARLSSTLSALVRPRPTQR
jgi:signal transduction histidine kinase